MKIKINKKYSVELSKNKEGFFWYIKKRKKVNDSIIEYIGGEPQYEEKYSPVFFRLDKNVLDIKQNISHFLSYMHVFTVLNFQIKFHVNSSVDRVKISGLLTRITDERKLKGNIFLDGYGEFVEKNKNLTDQELSLFKKISDLNSNNREFIKQGWKY